MNLLDQDIKKGLRFINQKNPPFYTTRYYPPYFQTNEALYLYYSSFPIKDNSVLTVAGSGDHVLEALHQGAKKITAFDQNRFAYYITALKMASIESLSLEEYLSFFAYQKENPFKSSCYYEKIRKNLAHDTRTFWDHLYQKGFSQNTKVPFLAMPHTLDNFHEGSYLTQEGYQKTKEQLQKADYRFIESKYYGLPSILSQDEKYDTMFFSNIYDWIYGRGRKFYTAFTKYMINHHLNEEGKCAAYTLLNQDGVFAWEVEDDYFKEEYYGDKDNHILIYTYTKNKPKITKKD